MKELSEREKFHLKTMWCQFQPEYAIAGELGISSDDVREFVENSRDPAFAFERPKWAVRILSVHNHRENLLIPILKGKGEFSGMSMQDRLEKAAEEREKIANGIFQSTEDSPELALYEKAYLTLEEIADRFKTTPDAVVDVLNRQVSARMLTKQE